MKTNSKKLSAKRLNKIAAEYNYSRMEMLEHGNKFVLIISEPFFRSPYPNRMTSQPATKKYIQRILNIENEN